MESERLARAKRVLLVREMTKLSRREFAKKTGIPHSTMQHWEDGSLHALPEKSVMRLIKASSALGVHCSYDWLMFGKGIPPHYIDKVALVSGTTQKLTKKLNLSDEAQGKQIKEEITLFLRQDKDAVELVVPDDAMEPSFMAGEIVAGIRYYGKEIESLLGMDCIVLIQGGEAYLRRLLKGSMPGYFHLTHTNPNTTASKPFFYDVELVSAAPIVWKRKKISSLI